MEILHLSLVYRKVIIAAMKSLALLQQLRLEDSRKIKRDEPATFNNKKMELIVFWEIFL
jgi:hypothetical protein